ncbi:MAG TPA: ATP-grasp domain-containing protein [Dongiaceae bacterium]
MSGRALAVAAKRAGYRVAAIDLFGDMDMRASADDFAIAEGNLDSGFDADALVATAEKLAPVSSVTPIGFVYGTGLEAQPELIARLSRGRKLYGNPLETVRRLKNPGDFFASLDCLGMPHPEVRLSAPADARGWLSKKIGGSGGTHVQPAARYRGGNEIYFQRVAAGRPVGISFLADGHRAVLIGFNEQWTDPGEPQQPYRFAGGLQPAAVSDRLRRDAAVLLDGIVREFSLVGLNSLDVIDDGANYWILEVNPRPGANLDVYDSSGTAGLFAWHIAACEGRLPDAPLALVSASAMSILYAARPCRVSPDTDWPEWVADRPAPGARIAEGAPVCTVLAAGATAPAVRRLMTERRSMVSALLEGDELPAGLPGNAEQALAEAGHV